MSHHQKLLVHIKWLFVFIHVYRKFERDIFFCRYLLQNVPHNLYNVRYLNN